MKILVPLDGSELSESVFPCALALARRFRAAVILVRVIDPFMFVPGAMPVSMSERMQNQWKASAVKYLSTQSRRLQGVSVTTLCPEGSPREEIALAAQHEGCDLILMASHGHSGLVRWLLGSVAEGVLRISPCPVLLLRPPANAHFRHILIPIDGSPASLQVPQIISDYLEPGGQVTLLSCSGLTAEEMAESTAMNEYLKLMLANLSQVQMEGIKSIGKVIAGPPVEGILDWAKDQRCDLIAMATSGRSGLSHLWMGSVTEKIVRYAPCPVLVFPPASLASVQESAGQA